MIPTYYKQITCYLWYLQGSIYDIYNEDAKKISGKQQLQKNISKIKCFLYNNKSTAHIMIIIKEILGLRIAGLRCLPSTFWPTKESRYLS